MLFRSEKNIIGFLTFNEDEEQYKLEEIDLELPRKRIIRKDVKSLEHFEIPETEDKLKITVSGSKEEFQSFRKTKKYKDITSKGIKIQFKPEKISLDELNRELEESSKEETTFSEILKELVYSSNDKILKEDYLAIFQDK